MFLLQLDWTTWKNNWSRHFSLLVKTSRVLAKESTRVLLSTLVRTDTVPVSFRLVGLDGREQTEQTKQLLWAPADLDCERRKHDSFRTGLARRGADWPAVRVQVGKDSQHEVSQRERLEGGGQDDVAALRQRAPQEDGAGVDVGGRLFRLLGQDVMHPVLPVQLHLQDDAPSLFWPGFTPHYKARVLLIKHIRPVFHLLCL